MIGRKEPHSRLRDFLRTPGPALAWITGSPRVGTTSLARSGTRDLGAVWLRGSSLPAEVAGLTTSDSLREQLGDAAVSTAAQDSAAQDGPWARLFGLLRAASRLPHPPILVLDGVDPLLQDRRFVRGLEDFWSDLRAHGRRQLIVFTGTGRHLPEGWSPGGDGPRPTWVTIPLAPLRLREVAEVVPGWSPLECVAVHALVGGLPDFWSRVDPRLRPETNLCRLLLAPQGPCRGLAESLLPAPVLDNPRSLALLHALARGAESWGDLRRVAGVFRSSSELGPYVKGLVQAGLVRAERSLDASPRSRSRRYRLVHPLHGFWFGSVLPRLAELDGGAVPSRVLAERIGPEIDSVVQRFLPPLVRDFLVHHGAERFPAAAREAGAAWGDGYDLEVAATLHSGAVVYGHVHWTAPPPSQAMDRLGEEIRLARYGFGREARLRFLMVREEPHHELARRSARITGASLLSPADLVGPR